MDFIERWFGVSPDGGSGSLEITVVIVALLVLSAPLLVRKIRSTARRAGTTNER